MDNPFSAPGLYLAGQSGHHSDQMTRFPVIESDDQGIAVTTSTRAFSHSRFEQYDEDPIPDPFQVVSLGDVHPAPQSSHHSPMDVTLDSLTVKNDASVLSTAPQESSAIAAADEASYAIESPHATYGYLLSGLPTGKKSRKRKTRSRSPGTVSLLPIVMCDAVDLLRERKAIHDNIIRSLRSPTLSDDEYSDIATAAQSAAQTAASPAAQPAVSASSVAEVVETQVQNQVTQPTTPAAAEPDGAFLRPKISDGREEVHPVPTGSLTRLPDDGPEVHRWMSKLRLAGLPPGFALFKQVRQSGEHADLYLYGHPAGRKFRSSNEFAPHVDWMVKGDAAARCSCKYCHDVVDHRAYPVEPTQERLISATGEAPEPDQSALSTEGGPNHHDTVTDTVEHESTSKRTSKPEESSLAVGQSENGAALVAGDDEDDDSSYKAPNDSDSSDETDSSDEEDETSSEEDSSNDSSHGGSSDEGPERKKARLSSPVPVTKRLDIAAFTNWNPCRIGEVFWCLTSRLEGNEKIEATNVSYWPVLCLPSNSSAVGEAYSSHDQMSALVLPLPLPTPSELSHLSDPTVAPIQLLPHTDRRTTPGHYVPRPDPFIMGPREVPTSCLVPFALRPYLESSDDGWSEERQYFIRGALQGLAAISSWEVMVPGANVTVPVSPDSTEDEDDKKSEHSAAASSTEVYQEVLLLRWGTNVIRPGDFVDVALPVPRRSLVRATGIGMGGRALVSETGRGVFRPPRVSPFETRPSRISEFYQEPQHTRILHISRILKRGEAEARMDPSPKPWGGFRGKSGAIKAVVLIEGSVYSVAGKASDGQEVDPADPSRGPGCSSGGEPFVEDLRYEGFGRFNPFRVLVGRRKGTDPRARHTSARKATPAAGLARPITAGSPRAPSDEKAAPVAATPAATDAPGNGSSNGASASNFVENEDVAMLGSTVELGAAVTDPLLPAEAAGPDPNVAASAATAIPAAAVPAPAVPAAVADTAPANHSTLPTPFPLTRGAATGKTSFVAPLVGGAMGAFGLVGSVTREVVDLWEGWLPEPSRLREAMQREDRGQRRSGLAAEAAGAADGVFSGTSAAAAAAAGAQAAAVQAATKDKRRGGEGGVGIGTTALVEMVKALEGLLGQ
ncbi:hypothetical protein DFJ73DRAFT_552621 [Zopfochytrium polystomum]|nr:hypothetical protein DFJ73DRAFT_552621 [Zopfochytrium polystomum]